MPVPASTKQDAIEAITRLLGEFETFSGIGRHLGLNPSHAWQALHEDYVSPMLARALARKGYVKKPPLKDPRCRVWMRTDDINLATETFLRYYPNVEVKIHMIDIRPGDEVGVICPKCSADTKMILRRNKKNGMLFLGCPNWPKCQHTSQIPEHIKMEAAGQPKLF